MADRLRCPSCGRARTFGAFPDGTCYTCRPHPEPHDRYSRFSPRCALCWAEAWRALAQSSFICVWCAIRMFRTGKGRGHERLQ